MCVIGAESFDVSSVAIPLDPPTRMVWKGALMAERTDSVQRLTRRKRKVGMINLSELRAPRHESCTEKSVI